MFDLMPFERKTRNIANFFDTFEKTFFNDFPAGFSEIRTDILDKGDRYVLQAELPGFDKQDIKIDLNGETLTISAQHNAETSEDKDGYVRRERRYGSFARSFDVSNINIINSMIQSGYRVMRIYISKKDGKTKLLMIKDE